MDIRNLIKGVKPYYYYKRKNPIRTDSTKKTPKKHAILLAREQTN